MQNHTLCCFVTQPIQIQHHSPVFHWDGWGPNCWVLWPLQRDKDVDWLLGLQALKCSHDAFHLLIFLSQFLSELLTHRKKETIYFNLILTLS